MSEQTNSITGQFVLQQDWNDGFWGDVLLSNTQTAALADWTVKVTLPGSSVIKDIWGVKVIAQDGQTVTLAPAEPWAAEIGPGATLKVGMTLGNATDAPRDLTFNPIPELSAPTDANTTAPAPTSVTGAEALKYFGFNYASWWDGTFASDTSTAALKQLGSTGANLATIVTTQYQATAQSNTMGPTQQTESDANIIKTIHDAKAAGMDVMLKPHIDVTDTTYRGSIDAANPQEWFANYTKMMTDYARIAQAEGVKVLSIGTELMTMTKPEYTPYWANVIADIRKVYSGELTYAANWGEEQHIKFWDKVDYIGVDLYAPLTETPTPTYDQLVKAWTETPQHNFTSRLYGGKSILDYHKDLTVQWGKPLFFTEFGAKSVDGGNIQFSNPATKSTVDTAEQQSVFKSFVEAVNKTGASSWLKGVSVWNWEPIDLTKNSGSVDMYNFTPQSKPALGTISDWFHSMKTSDGSDVLAPPPAPVDATDSVNIVVNAHGTAAGGVNAHFNVLMDGKKIGEATVGTTAKDFAFTTSTTSDVAHKVQIQYDNDAVVNGADRNLIVDKITIGGKAVLPTAPNVAYDKFALDGVDVIAGQSTMKWNGALVVSADKGYFPATPDTQDATIVVKASGTAAGGVNAHFNVLVDGKKIGEATAGTTAKDFAFTTSTTPDAAHKVQVQYDNDAVISGTDRNLYVSGVTINGKAVLPTASNVTYDKFALDGQDVIAGQSTMKWNGTLVVNADKSYFPGAASTAPISAAAQKDAETSLWKYVTTHDGEHLAVPMADVHATETHTHTAMPYDLPMAADHHIDMAHLT